MPFSLWGKTNEVWTLISRRLGGDEVEAGTVSIKNLKEGEQNTVKQADLPQLVAEYFA